MHLTRVLTMAAQTLAVKPQSFTFRSRVIVQCPLRFRLHECSSSARNRKLHLHSSSRTAGLAACPKSDQDVARPLAIGNSYFLGETFDWIRIDSRGFTVVRQLRVATREWTRASVQQTVAAGSLTQNWSKGLVIAEDQQTCASVGKMVAVRDTVELTEMEERIFGILTAALNYYSLSTQLRVAGGWVRDKLLGRNSIDIDIALDNMLGRVFCEKVNEYLKTLGNETHTVGVIPSNPDQSKHLETANMRILGMSIDFVNLRAETYTQTSRIPQMEFGSPEQDAFRRDLTINSLFYNINTEMVEDFTGQGMADLKLGIIRTPLPSDTTFMDDPLRVCRAIRFGARFDFTLNEELKTAAASEVVRISLETKVSRERIGHEVELMLMGNQPAKAMQYVEELSLFSAVFQVPEDAEPDPPILANYGRSCVDALKAVTQVLAKVRYASEISNEQRRVLFFGALFLPLHKCACFLDSKKKRKIPVSTYLIRESLKLKNNDASRVETLHATALKFKPMIKRILQLDSDTVKDSLHLDDSNAADRVMHRVELGLLLMSSKELWRGALLLASVMENLPEKVKEGTDCADLPLDSQVWIMEKVNMCNTVEDFVVNLGLENVWASKPLLDGHDIMAALKLGKGGKPVQEWKERVLRWQLSHPQSTSEKCRDWILEENVKRLKTYDVNCSMD